MAESATPTTRVSMPPPPPRPVKRAAQVLDEDTYTEAIEAIIERDFFPDVPKLQNQLEWLQAVQSGDPAKVKHAQMNIARRRAGLKTPMTVDYTGTTAFTPGTALLRTPAMTPFLAAATATPQLQPTSEQQQQQQKASKAPNIPLDAFFQQYTGEDNASFAELLEVSNARKRAKLAHLLEDTNKPLLLEGPHSTDEYGTTGQTPSTLITWKHEPKNKLYYDTAQQAVVPYSKPELEQQSSGPPKSIKHTNTRLEPAEDQPSSSTSSGMQPIGSTATRPVAVAYPSAVASASNSAAEPAAGSRATGRGNYNYVATPNIAPGVEASPFITWGDIAGTPLRLELDEDIEGLGLDAAAADGPQFHMPQVRRREAAAREYLNNRGAAHAGSRSRAGMRGTSTTPRSGSSTPLLDSLRRSTPSDSHMQKPMSAAGIKLASKLRGKGTTDTDMDKQLRASYARTPGWGNSGTTPLVGGGSSRQTPLLPVSGTSATVITSKRIQASSSNAAGAEPMSAAASSLAAEQQGGSITDDLLKLG
eukprot:jgi/Chrzof1/1991/Cz10g28320.t1